LFGGIGIFGLVAEVSLGAMIMGLRLEVARENCERSQGGPEQHPESREWC
jgi:hypothetical protein